MAKIEFRGISKRFRDKGGEFFALKNIDVSFPSSGLFFIKGASGSGKSTLLNLLGGLSAPSQGTYLYDGKPLDYKHKRKAMSFLNRRVAFVFQDFNLLPELDPIDNLRLFGASKEEAEEVLQRVGLEKVTQRDVSLLSGGEQQRLAIARALLKRSEVLLLDEPTGNLDSENAAGIMRLLKEIAATSLVIVVTHDDDLAASFGDATLTLSDGKIANLTGNIDAKALSGSRASASPSTMPLGLMAKFIWSREKKRWWKNLLIFFILALSFGLSFFASAFIFYDEEAGYRNCFEAYDINALPVHKAKGNADSIIEGDGLLKDAQAAFGETNVFSGVTISASFDTRANFYLKAIVLTEAASFDGCDIPLPEKGHVVMSDIFAKAYGLSVLDASFTVNSLGMYGQASFAIDDDLLPSYAPADLEALMADSSSFVRGAAYQEKYAYVFVSEETVLSILKDQPCLSFAGADPFHKEMTKYYLSRRTDYAPLPDDTAYLYGGAPSADNEIALSASFAESLVKEGIASSQKDLLGEEFLYQMRADSDFDAPYADVLPFIDIFPEGVRVTGIVSDDTASIYLRDFGYETLLEEAYPFLGQIYAFGSPSSLASSLAKSSLSALATGTSMVNAFVALNNGSPQILFGGLGILLFALGLSLNILFGASAAKEGEKSYAILHSLGFGSFATSSLFGAAGAITTVLSSLLGTGFAYMAASIFNSVVWSVYPLGTDLATTFSLVPMTWWYALILAAFYLLIAVISVWIVYRRNEKVDVATVLKIS